MLRDSVKLPGRRRSRTNKPKSKRPELCNGTDGPKVKCSNGNGDKPTLNTLITERKGSGYEKLCKGSMNSNLKRSGTNITESQQDMDRKKRGNPSGMYSNTGDVGSGRAVPKTRNADSR